jgi:hypothetical protein
MTLINYYGSQVLSAQIPCIKQQFAHSVCLLLTAFLLCLALLVQQELFAA